MVSYNPQPNPNSEKISRYTIPQEKLNVNKKQNKTCYPSYMPPCKKHTHYEFFLK